MKLFSIRSAALAVGLIVLAVLPLAAAGSAEVAQMGLELQPGPDIVAFFEARGVQAQYVGKAQAEVPVDQWKIMEKIVQTTDFDNTHPDYTYYNNDHDILNTLVTTQLANAVNPTSTVFISIGGIVWSADQETDVSTTDAG